MKKSISQSKEKLLSTYTRKHIDYQTLESFLMNISILEKILRNKIGEVQRRTQWHLVVVQMKKKLMFRSI